MKCGEAVSSVHAPYMSVHLTASVLTIPTYWITRHEHNKLCVINHHEETMCDMESQSPSVIKWQVLTRHPDLGLLISWCIHDVTITWSVDIGNQEILYWFCVFVSNLHTILGYNRRHKVHCLPPRQVSSVSFVWHAS